jgi:hypothetical protein
MSGIKYEKLTGKDLIAALRGGACGDLLEDAAYAAADEIERLREFIEGLPDGDEIERLRQVARKALSIAKEWYDDYPVDQDMLSLLSEAAALGLEEPKP